MAPDRATWLGGRPGPKTRRKKKPDPKLQQGLLAGWMDWGIGLVIGYLDIVVAVLRRIVGIRIPVSAVAKREGLILIDSGVEKLLGLEVNRLAHAGCKDGKNYTGLEVGWHL